MQYHFSGRQRYESRINRSLPGTVYEADSHVLPGIMAAVRPLVKPQIVSGPKRSSDTRQTDMLKLSTTGGNPEALTSGCTGHSRARSWCQTPVTQATGKQSTSRPVASERS